jgi:Ca2+:H+ antiporter
MILPNLATTIPDLVFTTAQSSPGVVSLMLYGAFVFVQAVRHRDCFLPVADFIDHQTDETRR